MILDSVRSCGDQLTLPVLKKPFPGDNYRHASGFFWLAEVTTALSDTRGVYVADRKADIRSLKGRAANLGEPLPLHHFGNLSFFRKVVLTLMFWQIEKYSPEAATATFQEFISDQTFGVIRVPLE